MTAGLHDSTSGNKKDGGERQGPREAKAFLLCGVSNSEAIGDKMIHMRAVQRIIGLW